MGRSSADLPERHTKLLHLHCAKFARGNLFFASSFSSAPAILIGVVLVALGRQRDVPRACNGNLKLRGS